MPLRLDALGLGRNGRAALRDLPAQTLQRFAKPGEGRFPGRDRRFQQGLARPPPVFRLDLPVRFRDLGAQPGQRGLDRI